MPLFGWKAGAEQYPPNELLDYAAAAEQAGFDALDISDHFHPWDPSGQACFTWTWLGAATVRTQRMWLGTGLTCPIVRYHPAVVAQAAATLGVMAPGRAYLCVGTGEALNEYAATGDWPGYAIRQAMLAEAIALIRALFTGDEVTFKGDFYETHKARLYTRPDEPVPIYVSTLVPGSARFAGIHGDGLITSGGREPDIYKQILKNFEAGARSAGKQPSEMPRLVELNVAYTDQLDQAVKDSQQYWAGTRVPALFNQKIYSPEMSAENGKAAGADTIRKSGCFSDQPGDHVAFAQSYLDLGFDELYFHTAGPDQAAFLRDFGRDVLPRLGAKKPRRTAA